MQPFPSNKSFKKIEMSTKLMETNMLGNLFFHQIVQSFAFKMIVYGSICLCSYLALKMQSQRYTGL